MGLTVTVIGDPFICLPPPQGILVQRPICYEISRISVDVVHVLLTDTRSSFWPGTDL